MASIADTTYDLCICVHSVASFKPCLHWRQFVAEFGDSHRIRRL